MNTIRLIAYAAERTGRYFVLVEGGIPFLVPGFLPPLPWHQIGVRECCGDLEVFIHLYEPELEDAKAIAEAFKAASADAPPPWGIRWEVFDPELSELWFGADDQAEGGEFVVYCPLPETEAETMRCLNLMLEFAEQFLHALLG